MLAILSGVVSNIVILIVLVTILEMLLPRKDFRPFVNMVVGLVLMLMLLSPLRTILQLPGVLDPVIELRDSGMDEDVKAKTAMLYQVKWDMTLEHYRGLVKEKISSILQSADLQLMKATLTFEEDVNHQEFGLPRQIFVVAEKAISGATSVNPIDKVEVQIGQAQLEQEAGERSAAMETKIGEALGVATRIVEVWVLTAESRE